MADNFFAELQMLSQNNGNDVLKFRKQLNEIVSLFHQREEHTQEVTWFAELVRNLKPQTILEVDGFMVQPFIPSNFLPPELREEGLGFYRNGLLTYSGRFVFPVKDVKGDVMGFCGYATDMLPKYLDSMTYGYKAKDKTLYGMEKLEEYYKSSRPVVITEGLICTLYLRQEGHQALAALGSHLTPYVIEICKRFGERCIVLPDSDAAGLKFKKQCKMSLPKARVIQSRVAKDLDDSRKLDDRVRDELKILYQRFHSSPIFK